MLDITILAAWGEFIGGIAVVVSLIYLAGQVRQNSNLLRASATSTTAQLHMGQNTMIAQDPEVALLFYKGAAESLEEPDALRWLRTRRECTRRVGTTHRFNQCFALDETGQR